MTTSMQCGYTAGMANPRLLFVDDEAAIRLTLSAILKQKGFDVAIAASVPEALELIGSQEFDVLLSDLNIGEAGDGFTVVSAMRRTQPRAVTFILTGYPDFDSALLAIRNQVDDYFTKPADVTVLVDRITKRLNGVKPPSRSPSLRRVSHILQENSQLICDQWLKWVNETPELSQISLSQKERVDHIPDVLRELIRKVGEDSKDASPAAVAAAEKHGSVRCKQGYSIPQMGLEARLLQRAVTSTVQSNLLGTDLSSLIPDLVEIGESLASFLEVSVREYQVRCRQATVSIP
jgi:DNA-binding response OmpR family regulator